MNIKHILFPTDFSPYNDAALKLASTLAAEAHARLHIVHVHEAASLSPSMGEGAYYCASTAEDNFMTARERLTRIVPSTMSVWYEHDCLLGSPVDEIVAFAADKNIDLIVMASHGRTGLARLLMGSVAEGVMRQAPCPVLIVKEPPVGNQSDRPLATSHLETSIS